jgi:hypothetical protein
MTSRYKCVVGTSHDVSLTDDDIQRLATKPRLPTTRYRDHDTTADDCWYCCQPRGPNLECPRSHLACAPAGLIRGI